MLSCFLVFFTEWKIFQLIFNTKVDVEFLVKHKIYTKNIKFNFNYQFLYLALQKIEVFKNKWLFDLEEREF